MVHGKFEFSSKMQTVEIYSPIRDEQGKLTGLNHEAIFYDPESLVEPIRIVRTLTRMGGLEEGNPYSFIECVPNIYAVKGKATPVTPGQVIQYEVPDMYGRPWARTWQKYFEPGMQDQDEARERRRDVQLRHAGASAGEQEALISQHAASASLPGAVDDSGGPGRRHPPLQAHHSFASYDMNATRIVTGVVTRVNPDANHTADLLCADERGAQERAARCGQQAVDLGGGHGRLRRRGAGRHLGVLLSAGYGVQPLDCIRSAMATPRVSAKGRCSSALVARHPRPASTATRWMAIPGWALATCRRQQRQRPLLPSSR